MNNVYNNEHFILLDPVHDDDASPTLKNQIRQSPITDEFIHPQNSNIRIAIREPVQGDGVLTADSIAYIKNTLNDIPPDHLRDIPAITAVPRSALPPLIGGWALPYDGIALGPGTFTIAFPKRLEEELVHEVGHEVEFHMPGPYRQEWIDLHNESHSPADFITDQRISGNVQTNEREDFAETYRGWLDNSKNNLNQAATLAINNQPIFLQKMLFMGSLFANRDGTLQMYTFSASTATTPSSAPVRNQSKIKYVFTNNLLQIDDIQFQLSGNMITAINNGNGIWVTLSTPIPLPGIILNRFTRTDINNRGSRAIAGTRLQPQDQTHF